MRVVATRVLEARVTVQGRLVSAIGMGMLALVGLARTDTAAETAWMAEKLAHLRIFPAGPGSGEQDLLAAGGQILAVSQFTLYGAAARGRRPDFGRAMPREEAEDLFSRFLTDLGRAGLRVERGMFGREMEVFSVNWGPYTLILEREAE